MNAHVAKDAMTFVMLASLSDAGIIPARRDADRSEPARPGLMARTLSALRWLGGLPGRRAMLEELRGLSDHELADIGVTRAELGAVVSPQIGALRCGFYQ